MEMVCVPGQGVHPVVARWVDEKGTLYTAWLSHGRKRSAASGRSLGTAVGRFLEPLPFEDAKAALTQAQWEGDLRGVSCRDTECWCRAFVPTMLSDRTLAAMMELDRLQRRRDSAETMLRHYGPARKTTKESTDAERLMQRHRVEAVEALYVLPSQIDAAEKAVSAGLAAGLSLPANGEEA